MKFLQMKTIKKEFLKYDFICTNDEPHILTFMYNAANIASQRFFVDIPFRGQIKCSDGRWYRKSNVHIVSYWSYPQSMKDLQKLINDIMDVYNELINVRRDKSQIYQTLVSHRVCPSCFSHLDIFYSRDADNTLYECCQCHEYFDRIV